MVRVVGAVQLMWLQKLHFDMKLSHLSLEVVVLIEIWCPPRVVQFSHCTRLVSQFGGRSLE